MKQAVEQWISAQRSKLETGSVNSGDLDQLEGLIKEPSRQIIMYLTARSTNLRSGVVSWVTFDSNAPHEPELPSDDPPYETILDAVADGWRVVQFPIINLYEYKDMENDYLGFDFILEKWV